MASDRKLTVFAYSHTIRGSTLKHLGSQLFIVGQSWELDYFEITLNSPQPNLVLRRLSTVGLRM